MILIITDPHTAFQTRQALEAYANLVGPDKLTSGFIDLLESTNPAISSQHPVTELISYAEAGKLLGVSVRTVSRMVADGRLTAEGRKIRLLSVYRRSNNASKR